ncbi:hypothetical protein SANT12839_096030 [Streptomyces antimycoticus]|uniref:NERD domain-containing protein n=1 Tax=Streptomyces antimycoticus TaxID=68175 RepID=A0A4D4KHT9_9ACTN|nr:hypothetical protein SANT12839_096030 [Streptomyces antimycoticus]
MGLRVWESVWESRFLLALDFTGGIEEVLSQPFRLRFTTAGGAEDHTPDFLVLLDGAAALIDVRPSHLVRDETWRSSPPPSGRRPRPGGAMWW